MNRQRHNEPRHHYDRTMGKDERLSERIREDRKKQERYARSQRWLKAFFWIAFLVLLGVLVWQGVEIVKEYLQNDPTHLSRWIRLGK